MWLKNYRDSQMYDEDLGLIRIALSYIFQIRNGEGRVQYLSAVCMGCLEGWQSILFCRCCGHRWDGSDLVLGTCYTYDIFAATPCCQERLCVSQIKSSSEIIKYIYNIVGCLSVSSNITMVSACLGHFS